MHLPAGGVCLPSICHVVVVLRLPVSLRSHFVMALVFPTDVCMHTLRMLLYLAQEDSTA